MISIIDSQLLK